MDKDDIMYHLYAYTYTHTHTHTYTNITEYDSDMRMKETPPFATTWMDLENIMLSEISQRKLILYDLTYMWNLKKQTNRARE